MKNCPRCDMDLDPSLYAQEGEVWLRMDTRKLYRVTKSFSRERGGFAVAERLDPRGPQGCDPEWESAIYPDMVKRGGWVRVDSPHFILTMIEKSHENSSSE
jgi:hypothetical protein